jgi:hypothetical protein
MYLGLDDGKRDRNGSEEEKALNQNPRGHAASYDPLKDHSMFQPSAVRISFGPFQVLPPTESSARMSIAIQKHCPRGLRVVTASA